MSIFEIPTQWSPLVKTPVEEEANKEKAVESMKLPSSPKKKKKKMTHPKIKDLFKRKD